METINNQNVILQHNAMMCARLHKMIRLIKCQLMFSKPKNVERRLKSKLSTLESQLRGYANASIGARREVDSKS